MKLKNINVSLHEELMEKKKLFVAECLELGISDFGDRANEALGNLRKGINLLLKEVPQKEKLLKNDFILKK